MRTQVDTEIVSPLRVRVLGGFHVERGDAIIPEPAWKRRSAKTIVKLLAVESSHRLPREQIEDALWPDLPPDAARVNLRTALHVARRTIENGARGTPSGSAPSSFLTFDGSVVALVPDAVWIDADHFAQLAQRALAGRDECSVRQLEEALDAYGGVLLPDDLYEPWAEMRRRSLAELYLRLLLTLADRLERSGSFEAAIRPLQRALHDDPGREDLHRRLMRLHVQAGSRHAAVRQYHACVAALRELDVAPEPETEALLRSILAAGSLASESDRKPRLERPPLPNPATLAAALPLLGRDHAVLALHEEVEHAIQGQGRIVFVGGEAGVGKTRLVAEMAVAAWQRDMSVLWGTAYMRQGLMPYGPLVVALDGYVAALELSEQRAVAADFPDLARILPTLAGHASQRMSSSRMAAGDPAPTRMYASLVRFLTQLSQERPLCIVLDDLHAADAETLQLLHHIAFQIAPTGGGRRWTIVGTYRDDEVPPGGDLCRLIDVLTQQGLCRHIDLLHLARCHTDDLVRSLLQTVEVDDRLLDHIYDLSLGNPLFATELVRTLLDNGDITLSNGHWMLARVQRSTFNDQRVESSEHQTERRMSTQRVPKGIPSASAGGHVPGTPEIGLRTQNSELQVPPSAGAGTAVPVPQRVHDLIETRLRALGPEADMVLSLTAVAGMESTFRLLRDAARLGAAGRALGEDALLAGLDRALAGRLLEERGQGYAFRHPLLRAALYERQPGHRRMQLHRALAEAIEVENEGRTSGSIVEALAYHSRQCAALGPTEHEKAVAYLEQAGDRAREMYAATTAAEHFRALLDLLHAEGHGANDRRGARAQEKLGEALTSLARYDDALQHLEAACWMYRAEDDFEGVARVTALIGKIHGLQGGPAEGVIRVRHLLCDVERAATDDPYRSISHRTLARNYLTLAHLYFISGEHLGCRDAANQVIALTEGTGGDNEILSLRAYALCRRGIALGFLGCIDDGIADLRTAVELAESVGDLEVLARSYNNLASLLHDAGDFERVLHYQQLAVEVAERTGDPATIATLLSHLGGAFQWLGRWEEAKSRNRRSIAIFESIGRTWSAGVPHGGLCWMAMVEGDYEGARYHVERQLAFAEEAGGGEALEHALANMARLDIVDGHPDRAIARLRPYLQREATLFPSELTAMAELARGDSAAALTVAQSLGHRAREANNRRILADARYIEGTALVRLRRTGEGAEALAEALDLYRQMSSPFGEAEALEAIGELHIASGDLTRARESLQAALAIFRRLGARPYADRVQEALVTLV